MSPSLAIRTTGYFAAAAMAAAVSAPSALATPVGDTFDFGFSGFALIDGTFVFQDGEPGEEGGQLGPFTFGTPGSLSLFGNPLTLTSTATTTSPTEETWTFSLTADDGGALFDPQAGFENVTFFAFRIFGIGALGTDGAGTESDPIFSSTEVTDIGVWDVNTDAIEIIDSTDTVVTTRDFFDNASALGTRLHIGFTNAADSEIIISGGGDTPADTKEIRFTYVASTGTAPIPGDADGDGDVDDTDLGISISNFTGPVGVAGGKTAADGDTDGDGDVDDTDLGVSISGFTGPLAPVPEPASLALLALGGAAFMRRRR